MDKKNWVILLTIIGLAISLTLNIIGDGEQPYTGAFSMLPGLTVPDSTERRVERTLDIDTVYVYIPAKSAVDTARAPRNARLENGVEIRWVDAIAVTRTDSGTGLAFDPVRAVFTDEWIDRHEAIPWYMWAVAAVGYAVAALLITGVLNITTN